MNIKSITVALGAAEGESPKVSFHENGVPVKGKTIDDLISTIVEQKDITDLSESDIESIINVFNSKSESVKYVIEKPITQEQKDEIVKEYLATNPA